ncbi:MAG: hypothetical protein U0527_15590 [Candidatus Eisenbacteria bacterium]
MSQIPRSRPPVAVVALGRSDHRDEALPARVMGRARTLLGEIGRMRGRPHTLSLAEDPGDGFETEGNLVLAPVTQEGPLVDWIEGQGSSPRLDRVLEGRRRIVIIDTLLRGEKAGTVSHWHLEAGSPGGLTALSQYQPNAHFSLEHLAFWLEDDLPPGGLDFIGLEPHDLGEGHGISSPIRRRLGTISSQVTAVLIRILAEEGW